MARTVGDAITRVREILQDAAGTRYTDDSLLRILNDAMLDARSLRPDLFVYAYATATPQVTTIADTIPLPDQFFTALVYYIAGRAELRDDEFAVDGRAMTLLSAFGKKMVQGI